MFSKSRLLQRRQKVSILGKGIKKTQRLSNDLEIGARPLENVHVLAFVNNVYPDKLIHPYRLINNDTVQILPQ